MIEKSTWVYLWRGGGGGGGGGGGLVCGDIMCGVMRYFRKTENTFLVHSQKFVSVKLQKFFRFFEKVSGRNTWTQYLTDEALLICTSL